MDISSEVLAQVPLFRGLSESQLSEIARFSEERSFSEGQSVFSEGQKADCLFVLLEGEIALQIALTSVRDSLTVSLFRDPYHAFGWSGLIPTYHYSSNAVCRKPTRVVAIEGRPLASLLERDPLTGFVVMRRIAEMISARLRENRLALLKTA